MSDVPMPAVLDVARVRTALVDAPLFVRYIWATGSTNDDARPLLGEPAHRGAVLVAELQTAGHGRRGRPWIAPTGTSLTLTALLPRPVATGALWAVPFWAALAVDDAFARVPGVRARLIWPNDLFLHGRKVAGLLSVTRVAGDTAWVGVGIGINVRRPDDDDGVAAIVPPPRFLSDVAPAVEREDVLVALVEQLAAGLDALDAPEATARAWERRAGLPGARYAWLRDDGAQGEGTARGLGPDGALLVDGGDGEIALDLADVRIVDRDV